MGETGERRDGRREKEERKDRGDTGRELGEDRLTGEEGQKQ